jgi:hypothetical protein
MYLVLRTQTVLHRAYHVSASYVAPCDPDRSDSWQAGLEPHFTTGLSVWTHVQVPCLPDGTLLAASRSGSPSQGREEHAMELLTLSWVHSPHLDRVCLHTGARGAV